MTGSRKANLVLQNRDRRLLEELSVMRVIDREQAKVVAGFGSTTRVNARLLAMVRAGLLARFFVGTIVGGRRAIYTSTRRGAAAVGRPFRGIRKPSDELLVGNLFLAHQMAVNGVYVAVKHVPIPVKGVNLQRFLTFQVVLSPAVPIIPDGYFELSQTTKVIAQFLEVDLGTETLRRWREKVHAYLRLAIGGEFSRLFGLPRFRVLVLANSERRRDRLRKATEEVTERIFWFATLADINDDNLWSEVWLRPSSPARRSLL